MGVDVDVVALYETVILERQTGIAATFFTIPARVIDDPLLPGNAVALAERLEMQPPFWTLDADALVPAVAFVLAGIQRESEPSWLADDEALVLAQNVPTSVLEFASHLVYSAPIPWEESPLKGVPLATVMAAC